jgi:hypothetical protein
MLVAVDGRPICSALVLQLVSIQSHLTVMGSWTPRTTSLNTERYYSLLFGSGHNLGRRLMLTFEHWLIGEVGDAGEYCRATGARPHS